MQNQNNYRRHSVPSSASASTCVKEYYDIEGMRKRLTSLEEECETLKKAIADAEANNKPIGYDDDPIFLLSVEEYERFKDVIPFLSVRWWLRTPYSNNYIDAHYVDINGNAEYDIEVSFVGGIRPVIDLNKVGCLNFHYFIDFDDMKKVSALGTTWVKLTDDYYIAENPISFRRFDEETNIYEQSEIRQFLLDWFQARNV